VEVRKRADDITISKLVLSEGETGNTWGSSNEVT